MCYCSVDMKLKENIKNGLVKYQTDFNMERKAEELIFKFHAYNSAFYSAGNKYNDAIYQGSVVEIFITYGKENHYYEVEVAPNGTAFLADIKNINGKFETILIDDCFIKTETVISGNDYEVTIHFPLDKIKTESPKFNAFRIELANNQQNLYALNPTMCDSFHKMEAFIDLLSLL